MNIIRNSYNWCTATPERTTDILWIGGLVAVAGLAFTSAGALSESEMKEEESKPLHSREVCDSDTYFYGTLTATAIILVLLTDK